MASHTITLSDAAEAGWAAQAALQTQEAEAAYQAAYAAWQAEAAADAAMDPPVDPPPAPTEPAPLTADAVLQAACEEQGAQLNIAIMRVRTQRVAEALYAADPAAQAAFIAQVVPLAQETLGVSV